MSTAAHDKNEASEEFKRMSPLDVKTANSIEIELGKYLQSNNIAQNVFEANTIPELTDMVKNANARANITITNLNNSINEENKSIVDIKTGADSQIKDIVNEQVSSMDDIEKNVAEQKQLQNEQQDLDQEISKLTLRNSELSKEHDQLTIQLKECSEEQKKISIECSVNTEKEKKELTLAKESAIKELNILGSQLFSLNAQSDAIVKEDKLAKEKFDKKNKDIDDEINEYEKMLNIKNEPKPTSSSIDEQSVLPSIITDQTTNSSKPNQDISLKEDESDLKVN
jgi:chromosome segregation ATPase